MKSWICRSFILSVCLLASGVTHASWPIRLLDSFYEKLAETRGFAYRCDSLSLDLQKDCDPATGKLSEQAANLTAIQKKTVLTSLAQEKKDQVTCALAQVNRSLRQDVLEFDLLLKDTEAKVRKLSSLMKERVDLGNEALRLSYSKKSEDKEKLQKIRGRLKEIPAEVLSIENTISFGQTGPLADLINKYVTSISSQGEQQNKIDSDIFKKEYHAALTKLREELKADEEYLQEGVRTSGESLDRSARENLIQDNELVEGIKKQQDKSSLSSSRAFCELNNTYGDGAKLRDQSLSYGSIGLSLLSGGTGALTQGAAKKVVAISATSMLGRGLQAAHALGRTGVVFGLTNGVKELTEACGHFSFSNKSCDAYSIKAVEQHNCKLTLFLQGGSAAFGATDIAGIALSAKVSKDAKRQLVQKGAGNPQIQIWNHRAAGQIEKADEIESQVSETLKTAKIVSKRKTKEGLSNNAQFVKFEDGTEGVWKAREARYSNPGKEVAAYVVDQQLGLDLVPVTVLRTIDGVPGSIQLRVKDVKGLRGEIPDEMRLFDLLIDNPDRANSVNWLKTKAGKDIAIDHDGRTFWYATDEYKALAAKVPNYEKVLQSRPDVIKKLEDTSPEQWRKLLSPHLNDGEIDGFLEHRKQMLLDARRLRENRP